MCFCQAFTEFVSFSVPSHSPSLPLSPFQDEWDSGDAFVHATPTQQQQTTALIIMGMIGAEFSSLTKGMPAAQKAKAQKKDSIPSGER